MQKEIINKLQLTIAKLELKQLEVVEKLSIKNNDYIIRCITNPETKEILSINGDWELVTGFKEKFCVGKSIDDFMVSEEFILNEIYGDYDFNKHKQDMVTINEKSISVNWRSKFFPNINAVVSIGRVKRREN